MIPVAKEPFDMYENFGVHEKCHFCGLPTVYWHENTNNPVCNICAKTHKVGELPDHGQRIRAVKRMLSRKSQGA